MSTSDPARHPAALSPLRCSLEAAGLAIAFALLPELAGPRTGALQPHPGWIAVLVLSARAGGGGFFAGLLAAAGAVAVGTAVTTGSVAGAWVGLDSGPNLVAFGACLAVSWVASWHLRRQVKLRERLGKLSERISETEAANQALREVVGALRARVDRAATSLSFLRDVAARLDGTDPVAAAEGAADLALARTGASAAMVQVGMGGVRRPLAIRDARGPGALSPLEPLEADLTVPIRNGIPVGTLTLWGVPRSGLDDATSNDLAIIASWCLHALAPAAWRREVGGDGRKLG